MIVVSDSPGSHGPKRSGRGLAKKRRTMKEHRKGEAAVEATFCPCARLQSAEALIAISASEIKELAMTCLQDIDLVRVKSGRLQGRMSGLMKRRVDCLEAAVSILVGRVEAEGDLPFLRERNSALAA